MEVTRFRRATGELADRLVAFGLANIERHQQWLDRQLEGRRFGSTAPASAGVTSRSRRISIVPPGYGYFPKPGSRLAEWFDRVNQEPAVAPVIDQMKQTVANLPDLGGAPGRRARSSASTATTGWNG